MNALDGDDLKKFLDKAKRYAIYKGYGQDAEDFAHEAYIGHVIRGTFSLRLLFVDFLREFYGNTRTPVGRLKSGSRHRPVALGGSGAGHGDGGVIEHEPVAPDRAGLEPELPDWTARVRFGKGIHEEILQQIINEATQAEVAQYTGFTETRISQLKRDMKKEIRDAMVMDEAWDRYHYDREFSILDVDWVVF